MSKKNSNINAGTPLKYWLGMMGGNYLTGAWLRRNIGFILLLIVMVILYISNRYNCQQAMLEEKQLNDTLLDRRYKALTARSQLQEYTLRSNVEENLADSTLHTAREAVYTIEQ